MAPKQIVVLVNADFESRKHELEADGPRGYEADAAVLDTADKVASTLRALGHAVSELRVTSSLAGVQKELRARAVDVVFNLVESIDNDYGREWQVPTFLEKHGFAYTGNSTRPLLLCRTKDRARRVLSKAGVRVATGFVVQNSAELARRKSSPSFPVFVKPARVDGSIGIDSESLCNDAQSLRARVEKLQAHLPGPYLVEEYLPGKELNVAIFPSPSNGFVVPTEIDFSPVPAEYPRFITYDSKWNEESPEFASKSVPAQISDDLRAKVEEVARRAFVALGGSGYGRVDMRLDSQGRPCVIDVNPNNDIHPDAGLAAAARSVGLAYPELLAQVIECAIEHAARRALESTPAESSRG
jgi:D-alanine-D-alanine ligase